MQTVELENTIDLSVLPATAQQTLLDFYEFLIEKYVISNKNTLSSLADIKDK